jgi:Tol biopolymer transport system component
MVQDVKSHYPRTYLRSALLMAVCQAAAGCGELTVVQPPLPPLSGRVAFASLRGGQQDIFILRLDGSGENNLTKDADDEDRDPVWSPDGRRIAFTHYTNGDYDIYVMNADGTGRFNVTNDPAIWTQNPSWSPDGSRLAYNTLELGGGITDLESIGIDGTGRVSLGQGIDPAWSPDGAWLAFRVNDPVGSGILVERADGSDRRRLSPPGAYDLDPAWSPDGRELVFADAGRVAVMAADGSGRRVLSGDVIEADHRFPAWSPDGSYLVFTRSIPGPVVQLFAVDRAFGALRQLTFDSVGAPGSRQNVPLLLARLRRTTDDEEKNALFYTFSEIACVHPEMRGNRPLADTLRLIAAGIEDPRYRRSALWHVEMFDTTRAGCHSGTTPPPEYVP